MLSHPYGVACEIVPSRKEMHRSTDLAVRDGLPRRVVPGIKPEYLPNHEFDIGDLCRMNHGVAV